MDNSICIYVHWPWCNNICNFCDFYRIKNPGSINYKKVIDCYIRDLKNLNTYFDNKKIISLNIGGGSPSTIKLKFLQMLIDHILQNYAVSKSLEVAWKQTLWVTQKT